MSIFLVILVRLEQQAWFQVCVVPLVPFTYRFHHSFDLMSSSINYIFLKTSRQFVVIIVKQFEFFQDIYQILDEKYHPCPRWFVLSSTILLPSIQHKLVRVLCCTLISLLSSLWYVLPWSITIFYVRNVVRISPPRMTSWYSDTSPHHHSFLVPM